MIQPHTIQEILTAARIEEVVGDYVNLKKRGVNYIGNCPFHNEKTPSFTVSPVKGIFKCFGCGKGGNSVNFIMEHDKVSYPEALKIVASRYGIVIEEAEPTPEELAQRNEEETLYALNQFAQEFFKEKLHNSDEGKAIGLTYLYERGFTDEIIEKFQIGYCPDTWDSFAKHATSQGYQKEQLIKAGLCSGSSDRIIDFFRGRIVFPIHNITGRVVGFTGRILKKAENTGKYVNSPETSIFQKRLILYGLYQGKSAINAQDTCYLVEGQADVIGMHQAGVENTVASSGTALTAEQIKLIRRYTKNVTLIYDADPAGIKASMKAIDLIVEEGLHVRLVLLPEGEDPDSMSRKMGGSEFREYLKEQATDFIHFKAKQLIDETGNDPIKKAEAIKSIVQSISLIQDGITRSIYVKECSDIFKLPEQMLLNELNKLRRKKVESETGPIPLPDEAYKAPTQQAPQLDSFYLEPEMEVIRFLLMYGKESFEYTYTRIEGEGKYAKQVHETITTQVSPYIIGIIVREGIEFNHPLTKRIFDEFANHLAMEKMIDEQFFIQLPDTEINSFVIDLISIPYEPSKKWDEIDMRIKREAQHLKENIDFNILKLQSDMLEKEIKVKQKELATVSEEESILVLRELKMLLDARKEISNLLGDIVIIR